MIVSFKVKFFLLFRLTDEERKKSAAKARSLKHKQKVSRNPELREAYREKERERYTAAGVICEMLYDQCKYIKYYSNNRPCILKYTTV